MTFVHNIQARNVNHALGQGLRLLVNNHLADREESRNGPVRVMKAPVITIYSRPHERVLFSPLRNANPFFHLFEALWMLNGEQDLPWLAQFNKQMAAYSDDGGLTQPAAYGYRWRRYFGYDQLDAVVKELQNNRGSRRAVLAMWDGGSASHQDFGVSYSEPGDITRAILGSADIPCNTHCYFRVLGDRLDMTVMCRSNDILWGAYGANAVHFSILQEYVAARLGLKLGVMYQLSNNYHFYENVVQDPEALSRDVHDLYDTQALQSMPMFADPERFMAELPTFIDLAQPEGGDKRFHFEDAFLQTVAVPMLGAWWAHKRKDYADAEAQCGKIAADDWRVASRMWIERRAKAHREKQNG